MTQENDWVAAGKTLAFIGLVIFGLMLMDSRRAEGEPSIFASSGDCEAEYSNMGDGC